MSAQEALPFFHPQWFKIQRFWYLFLKIFCPRRANYSFCFETFLCTVYLVSKITIFLILCLFLINFFLPFHAFPNHQNWCRPISSKLMPLKILMCDKYVHSFCVQNCLHLNNHIIDVIDICYTFWTDKKLNGLLFWV